jgi:hypothetical protein
MAYDPQLEPGEKITLQIAFQVSPKAEVFNFAVSDKALYWPATKLFAVNDATYFKRVQNDQIVSVSLRRLPPYGFWILAGLMFLFGLITSIFMLLPIIKHEPGMHRVTGWGFAFIVGGILMPFAARGRFGLEIKTQDNVLRWKPPLVVDKPSRNRVRAKLEEILDACERSGIKTVRP